jgi:transposase-like protein
MERGEEARRHRRAFTPEFKAEIVELCLRGDRSVGQVARDFDLTETAVREWVKQAERDAGSREDGGLTSAERRELAELRRENRRLREAVDILKRGDGFLREGDPVNCYPFIEAEKAQQRNVKRACELLKVSRAACRSPWTGSSGRTPMPQAFQQGKHLTVDGIVGPDTWSALIVQVSEGSTGDAVRGVQEEFQFRNLSGDPGKGLQIDGIFGPKTNAAVRGFQHALGLTTDGIVGPLTWRALVSAMLSG